MKITKKQLKQIIKEELGRMTETDGGVVTVQFTPEQLEYVISNIKHSLPVPETAGGYEEDEFYSSDQYRAWNGAMAALEAAKE
jgi:hypothetical protein